jgi:hypothetical protein
MPRTIRMPTQDGEHLRLEANRLGIPDDSMPYLIRINAFPTDAEPRVLTTSLVFDGFTTSVSEPLDRFSDPTGKWTGYRYEAIGTLASDDPLAGRPMDLDLGLSTLELPSRSFQVWSARAYAPNTGLYAQVDWRPGDERPAPSVGNWPSRQPSIAEIALVHQAMGLIWKIDARGHGGRQEGWRKGNDWDRAAFQGWKSDRDLESKPATLPALAEALGVKSPQTARRRLRELKPPLRWPPEKYPADWDPYSDTDDE